MVAVVGEAVKKLPEFRTRDLQRFIDALFTSTALQGGRQIETELASRIERFGQALCNVSSIDRSTAAPAEDDMRWMAANGDLECSLASARLLMSSLNIGMPSRAFMRSCFAKAWKSLDNWGDDPVPERSREYTAAEVNVSFNHHDQRLHQWVVRCEGPLTGSIPRGEWLSLAELGLPFSHYGGSVSMHSALATICDKVTHLVVD